MLDLQRHRRNGLWAEWLVERLVEDTPTLFGIDHGFSFPLRYFEVHHLKPDRPTDLDNFQHHWPTDRITPTSISFETGSTGDGAARMGHAPWRLLDGTSVEALPGELPSAPGSRHCVVDTTRPSN